MSTETLDICLAIRPDVARDEQVVEAYKNVMNEKLRSIQAPYLLERHGLELHPVGVIHNIRMKCTWVF